MSDLRWGLVAAQDRIRRRLRDLREGPGSHSKRLVGSEVRSSRVGQYRILFDTDEERRIVIGQRFQSWCEM